MSDKNINLLEVLRIAPEGHGIYEEVERTKRLSGLSVEQINGILIPYTESILNKNKLSEEEVREIVFKMKSL